MKRILLGLLIALPLVAQEPRATTPPPGGGPRDGMMKRIPLSGPGGKKWWDNSELAAKLNLTDQQKAQSYNQQHPSGSEKPR